MIRLAQESDAQAVLRLCRTDDWDGTAVWSDFTAKQKGADTWGYCDIWLGFDADHFKQPSYLLCRHTALYRLVGKPASPNGWQELHDFLITLPEGTLTAEYSVMEEYSRYFPASQPLAKHVRMVCKHPVDVAGIDEVSICTDFGETYDVRAAQSPGFATHVTREEYIRVMNYSVLGNNQAFELRKDTKLVSEGIIILFEELPCGLITDIYTMPLARGHGYAAQVVAYLCKQALEAGKMPILDCDSLQLERYYSRLGFETCGYWSECPLPRKVS